MSNEHVIYVISNANADEYSNSLTEFTNRLPKHLELKKSEWEVGLTAYGVHLNFCSVSHKVNEIILAILGCIIMIVNIRSYLSRLLFCIRSISVLL